jgi:D-alanyl-D-alanine carboxypeptidase/D-alanyl-D-alanine-endopeptidase (penicillin-binding protein 4)
VPGGAGGRQRITVEGRLPAGQKGAVSWRKVDDPPRYLGETLRRLLEQRGLKLSGQVRLGPVAPSAQLVEVLESEPLAEVVRRLNKSSNNFVGEQLLKALGAATAGPPGSTAAGLAEVERFLASLGIPRGAYLMTNGSGLNDANRFSARQTALLLADLWRRFALAPEFVGSLPVAGRDGTIRWRLEDPEVAGRVRAKTGTLDGVAALSGYAETAAGERLAFALIVNDAGGRAGPVTAALDRLTSALVTGGAVPRGEAVASSSGPARTSTRGALAAATPGAVAAPVAAPATARPEPEPADVDAAARTYLALGRSADPRNVTFLRSALRSESTPEVKLAVAEALYRSDPDGAVARRGLLEGATALAEPPLARLLPLVPPGSPAPVLGALGDLAGEGNGTAFSLLLGLAPGLPAAGPTRDAWRAVLGEVAEAAPDDLAAALAAAPAPTREAATALLGAVRPGG